MTAPLRTATRLRLAAVAALLALVATLLVGPATGSVGVRAIGPLPACRYDDILTTPRGYDDWSTTLVDTILRVTKTYAPPDLVPVSEAGLGGKDTVRAIIIDDLRAMTQAAAAAKAPLGVQSAYRSYADQKVVFNSWVSRLGYARALQVSARPGHSEHQLGLALDFKTKGSTSPFVGDWGTTAAGMWLKAHAWEYGFVNSYPKGDIALTCYDYEPWHYRYVGRELAAEIHASGLTPRQYLWANFTTTVVPPKKGPVATGAPGRTATPAPTTLPSPSPTLAASPTPDPSAPPSADPSSAAPATIDPATTPADGVDPVDPAVAAGALPALLVIAAITFALIIGGGWLAARRRRPGPGK
jgi:LAS superfamily LD-carboxypeptidase LdcB